MKHILIPFFFSQLPFALLLLAIGCFKANADTEELPPVNVEVVEAEIEIIDNTIGYAIILD